MGGAGAGPPCTSLRAVAAAAVALWLVPAVLALAILWLPPLCCAVAAVRFVRVRRKLVVASTSRRSLGCCDGDGEDCAPEEIAGGRLQLLQQYLDNQIELVIGEGYEEQEEGGAPVAY